MALCCGRALTLSSHRVGTWACSSAAIGVAHALLFTALRHARVTMAFRTWVGTVAAVVPVMAAVVVLLGSTLAQATPVCSGTHSHTAVTEACNLLAACLATPNTFEGAVAARSTPQVLAGKPGPQLPPAVAWYVRPACHASNNAGARSVTLTRYPLARRLYCPPPLRRRPALRVSTHAAPGVRPVQAPAQRSARA